VNICYETLRRNAQLGRQVFTRNPGAKCNFAEVQDKKFLLAELSTDTVKLAPKNLLYISVNESSFQIDVI